MKSLQALVISPGHRVNGRVEPILLWRLLYRQLQSVLSIRFVFIVVVATLASTNCFSQRYLAEINVRANILLKQDNAKWDLNPHGGFQNMPLSVTGEVFYFPLDYVGIGGHFSNALNDGRYLFVMQDAFSARYDLKSAFSTTQKGLSVKICSPRQKRFYAYATFRYSVFKQVDKFDLTQEGIQNLVTAARVSKTDWLPSVRAGLVLRVTRRFGFNIFDIGYMPLPAAFDLQLNQRTFAIDWSSGLTYRFKRVK